jgi:MFS family permease
LYVLYEGYGYSVSSLYSLGFVAGAITSPFIGPIVDKIGRKKSAMLYCFLEMIINYLELFPIFTGLIVSRMIGGITTNLLFSVFESWLVSEHRSRGFEEEKLEVILRDSTIVSNSAAIFSGYLAHCLAANLGAVGPFQGAVVLTCVALILVWGMWTENYGTGSDSSELTTWRGNMGKYFYIAFDCIPHSFLPVSYSLFTILSQHLLQPVHSIPSSITQRYLELASSKA